MRLSAPRTFALLFGLVVLGGACERPPPRPHVFLLMVDTLRADRLEGDGAVAPLAPFLDGLRRRGTSFRRAYSQTSWTSPAIASLFTSRYPSQHGVTGFRSVLGVGEVTLAESLRAHGYRAAAFSANPLISATAGFAQGFDHFQTPGRTSPDMPKQEKLRAAQIHRWLLGWLDGEGAADRPLFVYLHYMEPHTPYAPDRALLGQIQKRRGRTPDDHRVLTELFFGKRDWNRLNSREIDLIRDVYDAEVASLDRELERLFAELGRRGLLDDAVVIVTADHGEEFLEHGRFGHGRTLFEEVLRVPMLVVQPGQDEEHRSDATVSLIDVGPTLLELLSLPTPLSFEGISFAGDLDGPLAPSGLRDALRAVGRRLRGHQPTAVGELLRVPGASGEAEPHHRQSVVRGGDKLIRWSDGRNQTYDLLSDPGEVHPGELDAARAGGLTRVLDETVPGATPSGEPAREIDPAMRERLRVLGYEGDH